MFSDHAARVAYHGRGRPNTRKPFSVVAAERFSSGLSPHSPLRGQGPHSTSSIKMLTQSRYCASGWGKNCRNATRRFEAVYCKCVRSSNSGLFLLTQIGPLSWHHPCVASPTPVNHSSFPD